MRRALVLSGGGARGAYEVGLLRYLLEELPVRLGRPVGFDILCGTSVGAIHACYLAATAEQGPERWAALGEVWRSLRFEDVFSSREMVGLPRRLWRLMRSPLDAASRDPLPHRGILNTSPFERIVSHRIPWPGIRRNLGEGRLHAVSVTATDVASGRAVVFLERQGGAPAHWTPDPTIVARAVQLGPLHALASASIPFLFPAVRLEGRHYVDGSLRLNTPLVPALRLEADRILVAALRPEGRPAQQEPVPEGRTFVIGQVLNALLLDPLDTDLARMRFVNEILRRGERTFGADYLERMNATADASGEQPLKVVEDLVLRPSQEVSAIAVDAVRRMRSRLWTSVLLRFLDRREKAPDDDLLSYMLFDASYTEVLADLGLQDARRQEERLARFFLD